MLIKCTRNVKFTHPENSSVDINLNRGFIGEVPSWVEKDWYFGALCKDGSITVIKGTSDKDISAAEESNPGETPSETPDMKKVSGGKK